jgi:hypothetical protein
VVIATGTTVVVPRVARKPISILPCLPPRHPTARARLRSHAQVAPLMSHFVRVLAVLSAQHVLLLTVGKGTD